MTTEKKLEFRVSLLESTLSDLLDQYIKLTDEMIKMAQNCTALTQHVSEMADNQLMVIKMVNTLCKAVGLDAPTWKELS